MLSSQSFGVAKAWLCGSFSDDPSPTEWVTKTFSASEPTSVCCCAVPLWGVRRRGGAPGASVPLDAGAAHSVPLPWSAGDPGPDHPSHLQSTPPPGHGLCTHASHSRENISQPWSPRASDACLAQSPRAHVQGQTQQPLPAPRRPGHPCCPQPLACRGLDRT